jgi:hypothetical protein
MNPSQKRRLAPPAWSIDREIVKHRPGDKFSTPLKTALGAIVWWEGRKEPLEREPKKRIFRALGRQDSSLGDPK